MLKYFEGFLFHNPLPPAVIDFGLRSNFTVTRLNRTSGGPVECPTTHFHCSGQTFYCLPVFVRCNGVFDCPEHEDEMACDTYTCHGYYHCRFSHVCVHLNHLCDGLAQCPQRDDEILCNLTCPSNCVCFGNAFVCMTRFQVHLYPELRFLEGRGSQLQPHEVENNTMLVHLSLSRCGLDSIHLPKLHNLRSLDLSDNHLTTFSSTEFSQVTQLHILRLAGNPVTMDLSMNAFQPLLLELDLSHVALRVVNVSMLTLFPLLQTLNLSYTGMHRLTGEGFHVLTNLRVLDIRGSSVIQLPPDGMRGLRHLQFVYADNYKMCCPAMLPDGFNLNNCRAPSDEISSCEALLRSNLYRILLALFGSLATVGNLSNFIYRIISKRTTSTGFDVFVIHLCVSDLLMGVYLAVIGVADGLYRGSYLHKEQQWKHGAVCQFAGAMSFVSSEVSAFIISIITMDRFLALRFPFSQIRFQNASAQLTSAAVWVVGLALATVPLLPVTSHWEYYSQTGICIPLPITRNKFAGHAYSFGVMIILNFVLFLLISIGQLVIYWSVRSNTMSSTNRFGKSKNQTLARRLFTVALTDFLCWFPIGLLGLLASQEVSIPGEVNVAMAIIVLPLNSALNPFLYTLNMVSERRRRAREERLRKILQRQGDANPVHVAEGK